jgi:hypothetical protein
MSGRISTGTRGGPTSGEMADRGPITERIGQQWFGFGWFLRGVVCVLGTPVRSTFPIAEWAAGANAPRRRQLHQEAPPIRTRYAGMAAGYSDVDRCCRRPRTNAVRENGYPARLLQKRGAHPLSQRLEHWSAEVEAREMMGGSVVGRSRFIVRGVPAMLSLAHGSECHRS